jgi:hypothetical protein
MSDGPPLFPLGRVTILPGARESLAEANEDAAAYLVRHARGDWGELPLPERQESTRALAVGGEVLSLYRLAPGKCIWIVTDADRSRTRVLPAEEYAVFLF